MPAVPAETRAAILADLRAEFGSVRAIAAQHHVSPSTVSRVARDNGIRPAARTRTRQATRARQADYAAHRAQLRADLLADAIKIRLRFWQPCTVFKFGGKDNTLNSIDLPEPDFEGQQRIAAAVGILVDKLAVLERVEADADRGQQAGGLLDGILIGLIDDRAARLAAEHAATETTTAPL